MREDCGNIRAEHACNSTFLAATETDLDDGTAPLCWAIKRSSAGSTGSSMVSLGLNPTAPTERSIRTPGVSG